WESRNLAFNAGTAAAYGLSREEALMCITGNAARICGIDSITGTLEKGKDGTVLISEGDILDMATNRITHAFIQGMRVDLVNHQQVLYRKFMKRYGLAA